MKRHLLFHTLIICLAVSLFTGCKDKPDNPDGPVIPSGHVTTPDWEVSLDYDYSSSMTVIAEVDLTKTYNALTPNDWHIDTADLLAAFAGEECVGVSKPIDNLFFLYITSPSQGNEEITLRYYSVRLHNIFQANTKLTFVNGARLGSVNEPLRPLFEEMK
jgi:hypothetical protein